MRRYNKVYTKSNENKENTVGRCRLTPGCPCVDCAWVQRLNPKYGEPLSKFAFNFNLRRCSTDDNEMDNNDKKEWREHKVGRCRLTPG